MPTSGASLRRVRDGAGRVEQRAVAAEGDARRPRRRRATSRGAVGHRPSSPAARALSASMTGVAAVRVRARSAASASVLERRGSVSRAMRARAWQASVDIDGQSRREQQQELAVAFGAGDRRGLDARGASILPEAPRAAPSSMTRAWTAGSRTMPPAPTSSRPASNCGLTSAMTRPSGASERRHDRQDVAQRDERHVDRDEVERRAHRRAGRPASR